MGMDIVLLIIMVIFFVFNFFFPLISLFSLAKTRSYFDKLLDEAKKLLDGKCNTLNRYKCDVGSHGYSDYERVKRDLKTIHLFHKSVSCAKDVLSRNFINFNLIIAFMIMAFLF